MMLVIIFEQIFLLYIQNSMTIRFRVKAAKFIKRLFRETKLIRQVGTIVTYRKQNFLNQVFSGSNPTKTKNCHSSTLCIIQDIHKVRVHLKDL